MKRSDSASAFGLDFTTSQTRVRQSRGRVRRSSLLVKVCVTSAASLGANVAWRKFIFFRNNRSHMSSKNVRRGGEDERKASGVAFMLRALGHRNYRLFFSGQSVSLIGTWMTRIATSWLVYRLTGSALLLGVVGFAGQIPSFILAPFAGVLVDRWNRHRLLVATQVLAMLQALALALAILAFTDLINVHYIIWLSVFQGLINAFDMPVRQAFVVEMIERREDLQIGRAAGRERG